MKEFLLFFTLTLFLSLQLKAQQKQLELESFQKRKTAINQEVDSLIDTLITIAEDTLLKSEDRRDAIFLLADLAHERSFLYLLEHLDLFLIYEDMMSDRAQGNIFVCFSALVESKYRWNAIPIIFEILKKKQPFNSLDKFLEILKIVAGLEITEQLIDEKILTAKKTQLINLKVLKRKLKL